MFGGGDKYPEPGWQTRGADNLSRKRLPPTAVLAVLVVGVRYSSSVGIFNRVIPDTVDYTARDGVV